MEKCKMKTVMFAMVFLAALSFGKSFVSNMDKTIDGMQAHNNQIEAYYAQINTK
ncbi:hypothetical protein CIG1485E_a0055 (plasmid) [Campylobacter iguaniorum]|uniref:TMhelix containing protein n=1 Tax=Campylobacter iguaniorum TaxID=1244531 RepID=A0A076FBH0_9BACT|nr:hypothetical protein CIG1485E_a0055 [Campylobacter iguaniorum]